jgi:hypothetical protein
MSLSLLGAASQRVTAVCITALCATALCVTASPRVARAQEPEIVSVKLLTSRIPNGLRKYVYYLKDSASAPESKFATWQVVTSRTTYQGYPAMLRVMTFEGSAGVILDSMLTYERTMAPIRERSHLPDKEVSLDYNFRTVSAKIYDKTTKATREFQYTNVDPLFNASDTFIIIGSLPLRVGYRGHITSFTYEFENASSDEFRVTRADTVETPHGKRPAWVTSIAQRDIRITLWTDQATSEVLRVICDFPSGATLRLESAD